MKDILKWLTYAGLFAVPFLTLYVENEYFFPYITGKNFLFRIIVDFTLVTWVLLALYDVKYRPKWSWILGGAGALLVVMFFANLLGEHPRSSFWSNFERMDGYVSLVHTYLYMIILGSVLKTVNEWRWFLTTSLFVALLVAVGGLAQYFNVTSIAELFGITTGGKRIDSTLGNAAYMAVYTLFHIFIAAWLFHKTKITEWRIFYGISIPLLIFVLTATGTRGTAIALVVGAFVTVLYVGIFSKTKEYRNFTIGALAVLLVLVGGFFALKDTPVVQNQPSLSRIANISIDDLYIRSIIWNMAWEGVQERPILGWGQSNFNYVFNEQYDPRLYDQELWFDRAHNIVFDWLIAGGFLGLLTYFSIFAACIYYLVIRPWLEPDDESFTVLERGLLLGLLLGYLTHNIVVFDNIISYIFFAVILGLIHARVATPIKSIEEQKVDEPIIVQAALPAGAVAFIAVLVLVHVPGMAAASDIIDGFRALQPRVENGVQLAPLGPEVTLESFKSAIERDTFAHQEITEQLAQRAIGFSNNQQIPEEVRTSFTALAEEQLERLVAEKPGDARIHVFVSSYYRAVGDIERAAAEMAEARALSMEKQAIIIQQGFLELARNQNGAALDFFRSAYELDESNMEALEYYAGTLLLVGDVDTALSLMESEEAKKRLANSQFVLGNARQTGANQFLIALYQQRIESNPTDAQNWASLSFLQYEAGNNDVAVELLEEAAVLVPNFASTATCVANNIRNGNDPQAGC